MKRRDRNVAAFGFNDKLTGRLLLRISTSGSKHGRPYRYGIHAARKISDARPVSVITHIQHTLILLSTDFIIATAQRSY